VESLSAVVAWATLAKSARSIFVKRYDFVVATQVYPAIKNGLPSYLPAIMEVHLIAGIFGALLLTYTLGEKLLPLNNEINPGQ
jgi:Ni/Fe-hydrogenase subunit HybB-like protein